MRLIAFSRASKTILDTLTTPGGISWALIIDKTRKRLRIFDGTTLGGIELLAKDDIRSLVYNVPTTGATISLDPEDTKLIVNPAGTLATLTIELPGSPVDGDVVEVIFSESITALTVTGEGSETVTGGTGTVAANAKMTWTYKDSITTWFGGH